MAEAVIKSDFYMDEAIIGCSELETSKRLQV